MKLSPGDVLCAHEVPHGTPKPKRCEESVEETEVNDILAEELFLCEVFTTHNEDEGEHKGEDLKDNDRTWVHIKKVE